MQLTKRNGLKTYSFIFILFSFFLSQNINAQEEFDFSLECENCTDLQMESTARTAPQISGSYSVVVYSLNMKKIKGFTVNAIIEDGEGITIERVNSFSVNYFI